MPVEQIVRAEHASRTYLGRADTREFAACEFPREDYRWVAQATRRAGPAPRAGLRARWGRFWRTFGTPEASEAER